MQRRSFLGAALASVAGFVGLHRVKDRDLIKQVWLATPVSGWTFWVPIRWSEIRAGDRLRFEGSRLTWTARQQSFRNERGVWTVIMDPWPADA